MRGSVSKFVFAWKSAGWSVMVELEGRGEVRAGRDANTSLWEKGGK